MCACTLVSSLFQSVWSILQNYADAYPNQYPALNTIHACLSLSLFALSSMAFITSWPNRNHTKLYFPGNSLTALHSVRSFSSFPSFVCLSAHYFVPLSLVHPAPSLYLPITDESISRVTGAERVQWNMRRTRVNNNNCLCLMKEAIITCSAARFTCLIKTQIVISAQSSFVVVADF